MVRVTVVGPDKTKHKVLMDKKTHTKFKKVGFSIIHNRENQPYVRVGARGLLHRVIMKMPKWTEDRNKVVDHIDGNPLNNQRKNLRKVTPAQNSKVVVYRGRHNTRPKEEPEKRVK